MVYAEQGALDLESELREHFQQEAVRDLEAFDRRLRAIEERLGIASERHLGRGKMLVAEREELTADEVAGIPLASGFDTFAGGHTLSADDQLREVLAETKQPKPSRLARDEDELPPEDVVGIPLAGGFA